MVQTVTLRPIGVVKSAYTDIHDRDWREVVAEIHVAEALAAGLRGVAENSHLDIIFYLHKSKFEPDADLIRHPMGRADLPLCGVFATRSNYRPCPVGVTTVELLKVDGNVLTVRGLDALDGTPVLDIKPYMPRADLAASARLPAWVEKVRAERGEDRKG
ncbi:MAG: tRNA (N6-threonylcarbamoyladenosine(37)-N6)-methyltransferase TrmO [Anaerolineae bacterium]|nr:tRNA (N6-threonylcarbamoyladenosine(37)-N6)-methyltransferase TrmO [Anaerolineae bacterium]